MYICRTYDYSNILFPRFERINENITSTKLVVKNSKVQSTFESTTLKNCSPNYFLQIDNVTSTSEK